MTIQDQDKVRGRRFSVPAASTLPPPARRRINATTFAILISVHKILVKGNKHYIAPSINRLRELLLEFHGIDIGRRWCFQCLANLAAAGLLWRKRRPRRMPDNTVRSRAGLIGLTLRGCTYLASKGTEKIKEARQAMIAWLHKHDNRFPGPSNIFHGEEITERSTALARLQELIKPIGSGPAGGTAPAAT